MDIYRLSSISGTQGKTDKTLLTAVFVTIMAAPFALAGNCSDHSDQAMTCATGAVWDADAQACVATST